MLRMSRLDATDFFFVNMKLVFHINFMQYNMILLA